MSLKEADWKAVLDQPKNAGLKAGGGTGISGALRQVDAAEKAFQAQQTVAHGTALDNALHALKTACEATINKHKKVYTTACDYLQQKVLTATANRMKALTGEMNELRKEEQEKAQRVQRKQALKGICDHALAAVRGAKDMNELNQVWTKFGADLEKAGHGVQNLQATIQKIKQFKKQPDPKVGILEVRAEYVQLVKDADGGVAGV
jgi:predicted RNase H-like nuclease (RuvC/YqgF family)